jgi:predicted DNA-binding transcriptional regulator AlpA
MSSVAEDTKLLSEEPRYLNVRETAARFAVSIPTIWKWTREGKFPKQTKFGSNIARWKVSDLDEWEVACQKSRG